MDTTEQHLKRIQDKLQQLLKNYIVLQKENIQLKTELGKVKTASTENQKSIDDLKQQADILRLNAVEMNPVDKKEFEKRINSYLKEIDRCIALLNE